MKNYNYLKTFLPIIFLLLALLLVLIIVYDKNDSSNKTESSSNNSQKNDYVEKRGKNYIVINDFVYSFYKNSLVSVSVDITKEGLKFKFYDDNRFLTKGSLNKISTWNILDENGNYVRYQGNLVAFTDNLDVSLINFEESVFNDSDYNVLLNSNKDLNLENVTFSKKYVADINDNGMNDYIYVLIRDENPQDGESGTGRFHFIAAVVDGKYLEIENVKHSKTDTFPNFYLNAIFVENKNIFVSFDAEYNPWDIDPDYNLIYRYDRSKFTKMIDK